jgi:hypothetical protein
VFIVVFSVSALLAKILISILGWPVQVNLFNPVSAEAWTLLKGYWFIHPLYFFGAIYFNNRVVMKTTATLFLLAISWLIFSAYMADLIISSSIESSLPLFESQFNHSPPYYFGPLIIEEESIRFTSPLLSSAVQTVITAGYFAYFWGLSLLRFKEIEL